MNEYIEMLIDSIETYDRRFTDPHFIIFYIPSNGKFKTVKKIYLAVLAATSIPNDKMIDIIIKETKKQAGNVIYAAEYVIMKKQAAINYLEEDLEENS